MRKPLEITSAYADSTPTNGTTSVHQKQHRLKHPKHNRNTLHASRKPIWHRWLWAGAWGLLLLLLVMQALSVRFVVQGQSMQPTYTDGDLLLVSRLHYLLRDPQPGDIAVFHFPGNTTQDYIKRVIAGPGDVVEVRASRVFVNGQALTEPYLTEACDRDHCRNDIWQLGPQDYFVLGDNRNRSSDSRSFGPVHRDLFVGTVLLRYWPLAY